MVWVTRSEREWVRRQEDLTLREEARAAEAHFARVAAVLKVLLADPVAERMLRPHGFSGVWMGRSMRAAANHRVEGLVVLEGVVLQRTVHAMLSDAGLVRWLSRHYPRELVALHDVCGSEA